MLTIYLQGSNHVSSFLIFEQQLTLPNIVLDQVPFLDLTMT